MTVVDPAAERGTWCCEWELSSEAAPHGVSPRGGHQMARVLVRLHGEPIGYLTLLLTADGPTPQELARSAEVHFAERIAAHLAVEGADVAPPYPEAGARCPNRVVSEVLVSVVVCTRNRADQLADCLERLRALSYPRLEIVVVDNAPSDDGTRRAVAAVAVADPRFRYVVEPRPGLSRARNRGLAEARGTWIAYTDDDVAVDPGWVQGLVRGYTDSPAAACVTGLVATAEISGAAEEYFDARAASWSTRCEPQLFALDGPAADDPLFPYSPGIFGTGASMAFERAHLEALGGFDEALGAGTPTRGGEDLDIFVRVLRSGRAIAYQPAALVWHHHRADDDALRRQMFGYGTGLSAFLTKCLLQAGTRRELLVRIPRGIRRMAAIRKTTGERLPDAEAAPRGALLREFLGFGAGPVLYLRARRAARTSERGNR